MNIYLVGMMGSGKSRVGRILAARMRWPMLDLDQVIEERTNQSIDALFEVHGESHFRSLEKEAMEELMKMDGKIIATGGGTPCHNELMTTMVDTGITIYLKTSPKVLVKRLMKDEVVRPLLTDLRPEAMEDSLRELMTKRRAIYERAAHHVNANQSSEGIVQEILKVTSALQSR